MATVADYTHLTALLAPRAALLTYNTKDNCCFESGYALPPLLKAARPIYKLYGKEKSLHSHENVDPGTHNFDKDNRQALYRTIGEHFYAGQKFDAKEIDCESELKTKEQLSIPLPENNASFHSLALALSKSLPRTAALPTAKETIGKWQQTHRAKLREVVKWNDYNGKAQKHASSEKDGVTITHLRLRIGESWTVPAVEFTPKAATGTTIVVDDGGRTETAAAVQRLLAKKQRVLAVDPFYFGESKIEERAHLFALMVATVGQRSLGIQASQLVGIANWLKTEHKGETVHLEANGPRSSLYALVAAAADAKAIDAVQLTDSLASLKQIIKDNRAVNETPRAVLLRFARTVRRIANVGFGCASADSIQQAERINRPGIEIVENCPTCIGQQARSTFAIAQSCCCKADSYSPGRSCRGFEVADHRPFFDGRADCRFGSRSA